MFNVQFVFNYILITFSNSNELITVKLQYKITVNINWLKNRTEFKFLKAHDAIKGLTVFHWADQHSLCVTKKKRKKRKIETFPQSWTVKFHWKLRMGMNENLDGQWITDDYRRLKASSSVGLAFVLEERRNQRWMQCCCHLGAWRSWCPEQGQGEAGFYVEDRREKSASARGRAKAPQPRTRSARICRPCRCCLLLLGLLVLLTLLRRRPRRHWLPRCLQLLRPLR